VPPFALPSCGRCAKTEVSDGNYSSANIDRLARAVAGSGTWVTPTLTTSRNVLAVLDDFEAELDRPEVRALHPMSLGVWAAIYERLYRPIPDEHRVAIRQGFEEFQRPFTLALHRAGGGLMTGTDALIPSTVPGFSLHDELRELVDAGLSPYEALLCSTTHPIEFLKELDRGGTIAVGKRADLVLLGGNPLADISNTRRISGVVVGGRWITDETIRSRMGSIGEGSL